MQQSLEFIRVDKWLWVTRFFKTRVLATEAVSSGKVHVNKQRVKPSKEVKIGSQLEIRKDDFEWLITVKNIAKQRVRAKEAALFYEESIESLEKRARQVEIKREELRLLGFQKPQHKPNKKNRAAIHRFKRDE